MNEHLDEATVHAIQSQTTLKKRARKSIYWARAQFQDDLGPIDGEAQRLDKVGPPGACIQFPAFVCPTVITDS